MMITQRFRVCAKRISISHCIPLLDEPVENFTYVQIYVTIHITSIIPARKIRPTKTRTDGAQRTHIRHMLYFAPLTMYCILIGTKKESPQKNSHAQTPNAAIETIEKAPKIVSRKKFSFISIKVREKKKQRKKKTTYTQSYIR